MLKGIVLGLLFSWEWFVLFALDGVNGLGILIGVCIRYITFFVALGVFLAL